MSEVRVPSCWPAEPCPPAFGCGLCKPLQITVRTEPQKHGGDLRIPPGVNNTPLNRWTCIRAGVVTGSRFRAFVATDDPCPATAAECHGRGCPERGECCRGEEGP